MGHVDRRDLEWTDGELVTLLVDTDGDFRRVGFELGLGSQHSRGERRRPYRCPQQRPERHQRTVVILMRMCDDDRLQRLSQLLHVADIGQHKIYARQLRAGKSDAAIHHDPLARFRRSIAIQREIHPDLANPAKRHEHQFRVVRHQPTTASREP